MLLDIFQSCASKEIDRRRIALWIKESILPQLIIELIVQKRTTDPLVDGMTLISASISWIYDEFILVTFLILDPVCIDREWPSSKMTKKGRNLVAVLHYYTEN